MTDLGLIRLSGKVLGMFFFVSWYFVSLHYEHT